MGHHLPDPERLCRTMKAQIQQMAIDHLWIIVFTAIIIFSAIVYFG